MTFSPEGIASRYRLCATTTFTATNATVEGVPELPEVEALAAYLRERAVGHTVERFEVSSFSALKTYDPAPSAVAGLKITDAGRHGKFLDVTLGDDLHLVVHLARAGWLHYRDAFKSPAPLKPGSGPIAVRVRLDDGSGFDLTEAGTQKSLAAYLVRDPAEVPGVARLGPDALAVSRDEFAERIRSRKGQIKGVLVDQEVLAGIGNAYSDEILHVARMSPFALTGKLTDEQITTLYEATRSVETDAVTRSVGQKAAELKGEKRAGMRVHARTGLPCPVCGDTVREVSFADKSLQYCPTCQTGGKPLADRRLSKLIR
ncbi:formamidopyrimidine-DNA glycosylase [Winogradskya humida]|uniref:Formamidopyrimidine-DNA glycosylase n=1 Tax=Winogradskya humida TaxID=113566 RepID=A0ABQ3ZNS4_9ACTN|nr:formamidopyrimidine-DNA glycosylase [Actinoplanes humidus]